MSRADDDGVESVHPAFFVSAISRQLHISEGRRREVTSNACPAQCLNCGQNRLASAIPARSQPIACVSIFLGYVGGAFARNTFGDMRMREETFEERWR